MQALIHRISQKCIERHLLEEDDREVYEYFLGLAISFAFNTLLVISIGFIIGKPLHSVLFLFGLILMRFFAGGYHTNSNTTCFVLSITFYLACFAFSFLALPHAIYRISGTIMAILGVGAVFAFAPVAHPNAPMEEGALQRNKKRSRWISSIWNSLCIILLWVIDAQNVTLPFMGLIGIFAASMLLIIARRMYYGKQNSGDVGKSIGEESAGEPV